jgi:hypothetical protein
MEIKMKKIVLAAAFAGVASASFAGSYEPPHMEPEITIIPETNTSSSSSGIVVALILVALIAAAY